MSDVYQSTIPDGQRLGQFLYNNAPEHIANFVNGDPYLDAFYAGKDTDTVVRALSMFRYLCWDVTDLEEMKLARRLVLAEVWCVYVEPESS